MNLEDFTKTFIFSYGVAFMNIALIMIVSRRKHLIDYINALFHFVFGLMCFAGGFSVANRFESLPANLTVYYSMALLGPIGSAFVLDSVGIRFTKMRLFHTIILGITAVYIGGTVLIFAGIPWKYVFTLSYGLLFLSDVSVFIFLRIELGKFRNVAGNLKVLYTILLVIAVQTLGMLLSKPLGLDSLLYIFWILLIFAIFGLTLLSFSAPETWNRLRESATQAHNDKTRLKKLDIPELLKYLEEVMETRTPFTDPELSLEDLASLIGISGPQLSEILNQHLGVNFSSYVNSWRIKMTKKRILAEPDSSILTIAFDSGFNTKSSFNAVFKKETGTTPTAYRKENT